MVDEFLCLCIWYHLMCSTPLVWDFGARAFVGWSMIATTCFILILRLGAIIVEGVLKPKEQIRIYCLKRRTRIKIQEILAKRQQEKMLLEEQAKQ
jgi:hypothetical protein